MNISTTNTELRIIDVAVFNLIREREKIATDLRMLGDVSTADKVDETTREINKFRELSILPYV